MNDSLHNERYLLLAEKWLNGTITPAEEEEYAAWYNNISEDDVLHVPANIATDREAHRKRVLQQINARRTPVVPLKSRSPLLRRLAAAAAVLLITSSVLYILSGSKKVKTNPDVSVTSDIKPGTVGAVLTLSNGKTILIDTIGNGNIQVAAGNTVAKTDEGLAFDSTLSRGSIEYYTLQTPNARQQKLSLPDGSEVWLNAASSIRFPSIFGPGAREVEITGEAYFEVAKDKTRPFMVKVNDAAIEVLGTHFNVMAYENESKLETTLLEGAVRFSKGGEQVVLKPGQQSRLSSGNNISVVDKVDTEHVIAWKNGMQSFVDADLKTIMRQVERWYDIKVEYKGTIPRREFSGDIPRSASLSELLRLFEINNIHFTIDAERKTLIVMP